MNECVPNSIITNALLSPNHNFELRSSLLTFGSANKLELLSLNHNLELRSSLLTFGSANKLALLSLNHNLSPINNVNALIGLRVDFSSTEVINAFLAFVKVIVNVSVKVCNPCHQFP